MQQSDLVFSHRPETGVSVGAYSEGGRLYVAASLVNDGTSLTGLVHEDRIDTFSRPRARQIITGRIQKAVETFAVGGEFLEHDRFTVTFATDMTAKEFMYGFRQVFKPDHEESDETFDNVVTFELIEGQPLSVRGRKSPDEIWGTVNELAIKVVTGSCVS